MRELPQRPALHRRLLPQHGRAGARGLHPGDAGSRPPRRRRAGARRRAQLPQPLQRRARPLRRARLHRRGQRGDGARLQDALAPRRRRARPIHARGPDRHARGRRSPRRARARGAGRPERAPPAAALRARDPSARLHSADYRSPAELPDGPALVVGGGNSGVQIAAELAEARPTTLAVGSKLPRLPQRVLGRSIFDWPERLGAMDVTVESRLGRHMSGHDVLIGESPERIARALGVRLAGRAVGVQGAGVRTADGEVVSACTVVWATGWRADHAWLRVPVADAGGRIVHRRGVSEVPGLSFLCLPWMHTRGSALPGWVGRDATYLAGRIAARAEAHATAGFAGSARRAGLAQRRARWAAM
ncbi:MAG TPA: FAD-dependent oxidoreductase [Longimicrobiales bacterium]|nr:FAD-dependent oxidoreductase [Longimicrobiales bacterium]